jgi:hypothetical protein
MSFDAGFFYLFFSLVHIRCHEGAFIAYIELMMDVYKRVQTKTKGLERPYKHGVLK